MRSRYLLGFVAAAFAAGLAAAPPADACINSSNLSREGAMRQVARAERLIAAGRYQQAKRLLHDHDVTFHLRRGRHDPLGRKVALLTATLALRESRGEEHVAGALRALEGLSDQDDPVVVARIAEAKAGLTGEDAHHEALAVLTDLEARYLVPDAEAFAALVKLRVEAGDLDGAGRAYTSCKKMTTRAKVCGKAPARPTS